MYYNIFDGWITELSNFKILFHFLCDFFMYTFDLNIYIYIYSSMSHCQFIRDAIFFSNHFFKSLYVEYITAKFIQCLKSQMLGI